MSRPQYLINPKEYVTFATEFHTLWQIKSGEKDQVFLCVCAQLPALTPTGPPLGLEHMVSLFLWELTTRSTSPRRFLGNKEPQTLPDL